MVLAETNNLLVKNNSTMCKDGAQNTKIKATGRPARNTYDKVL